LDAHKKKKSEARKQKQKSRIEAEKQKNNPPVRMTLVYILNNITHLFIGQTKEES
jgi:hypothetical protein